MTDLRQSEAQAIIDDVRKHTGPYYLDIQHPTEPGQFIHFAFIPGKLDPIDVTELVDEHRDTPKALEGTARLSDLASFVQHVRAFSKDSTVLFANPNRLQPELTAVYDYQTSEKPSFARHRATYGFQVSDQWKAWTQVAGRALSQAEFASFLEAHLEDLISPESIGEQTKRVLGALSMAPSLPSEIFELSKGLSLNVSSQVTQKLNSSTGERELSFSEEHKGAGGVYKLEVPKAFVIAIPVFQLGAHFQIPVRIQYRLTDGSIKWTLAPLRTENVFDAAFREACTTAANETETPLFYGIDEKAR